MIQFVLTGPKTVVDWADQTEARTAHWTLSTALRIFHSELLLALEAQTPKDVARWAEASEGTL